MVFLSFSLPKNKSREFKDWQFKLINGLISKNWGAQASNSDPVRWIANVDAVINDDGAIATWWKASGFCRGWRDEGDDDFTLVEENRKMIEMTVEEEGFACVF